MEKKDIGRVAKLSDEQNDQFWELYCKGKRKIDLMNIFGLLSGAQVEAHLKWMKTFKKDIFEDNDIVIEARKTVDLYFAENWSCPSEVVAKAIGVNTKYILEQFDDWYDFIRSMPKYYKYGNPDGCISYELYDHLNFRLGGDYTFIGTPLDLKNEIEAPRNIRESNKCYYGYDVVKHIPTYFGVPLRHLGGRGKGRRKLKR